MEYLLIYHSYFRWIVLLAMSIQFIWLYMNQKRQAVFTSKDFTILLIFLLIYDIQLILGWLLYSESALVKSFWNNVAVGVKHRQIRFFGLEHMTMMTLGIALANYFSFKSYKKIHQIDGFKYLWYKYIWFCLIIISSIPWSFSPLTTRPNFR